MSQLQVRDNIPSRYESVLVTPAMAAAWLAPLKKSKRSDPDTDQRRLQRNQKPKRIKSYANTMKRGKWNPLSVLEIDEYDGEQFVANGQNRLAAVVEAGVSVRFDVLFREMESHDEVRAHYATIDIGSGRTAKDIMKSQLFDKPKVLTDSQYGKLKSALSVIMTGFRGTATRTDTPEPVTNYTDLILQYEAAAQHFFELINPGRLLKADKEDAENVALHKSQRALATRLQSAPVLAVAIQILYDKQQKGAEFWHKVASLTSAEGTPEAQLVNFVLNNKIDAVGTNAFAHVLAKCWNAFYAKEELDSADLNPAQFNARSPIRIAGTKFKGKDYGYLNFEGKIVVDVSEDDEEEDTITPPAATVADQLHAINDAEQAESTESAEESETRELAAATA